MCVVNVPNQQYPQHPTEICLDILPNGFVLDVVSIYRDTRTVVSVDLTLSELRNIGRMIDHALRVKEGEV